VLGEPLLRRMREVAPDARLRMRLATPDKPDSDRELLGYDLLIAPAGSWPGGQPEVIVRDRLVYLADPANPALRDGGLTVEGLAALPHATVRLPYPGSSPADAALGRLGVAPSVVITTAGWLPLPFLISGTDLVALVPERLARQLAGAADVAIIEPPFGTVEVAEAAWWHPMRATDPALSWLRATVREVAALLDIAAPVSAAPVSAPLPPPRAPAT
jgi:DNA-binding transcriptional LysR family regulator